MSILQDIVENRIEEAIAKSEINVLNKDLVCKSIDHRSSNDFMDVHIHKNESIISPKLNIKKEIHKAGQLLDETKDDDTRNDLLNKINQLGGQLAVNG